MNRGEVKASFLIAWLMISLALLLVLIIPFVLPTETILSLAPTCQWKIRYDKECPLCGMTTAFLLISGGRFKEAFAANTGSLTLYTGFVVNELFVLLFLVDSLRSKRRFYQKQPNIDFVKGRVICKR
jgi:hypothetical protein